MANLNAVTLAPEAMCRCLVQQSKENASLQRGCFNVNAFCSKYNWENKVELPLCLCDIKPNPLLKGRKHSDQT